MTDLKNKITIITGASRGIGAATAREFARHGARVILAARTQSAVESVADDIRKNGGKADVIACDVTCYSDVEALVQHCQNLYGRLDILINNAGMIDPITRLADSDPNAWCRVADVNYKGVYFGLRAALPVMVKQKDGVIINISSGAATSALEGWSHYCSSKAAAASLTRCADKEYRHYGIRIIGLSPGTVATDMMQSIKQSAINPVSQLDWDSHLPATTAARAIRYLCSADAADLSGSDFSIKTEEGRRRADLIEVDLT